MHDEKFRVYIALYRYVARDFVNKIVGFAKNCTWGRSYSYLKKQRETIFLAIVFRPHDVMIDDHICYLMF